MRLLRGPWVFVVACALGIGKGGGQGQRGSHPGICVPCVQGEMSFLASDALQGRGSGTRNEHLAAEYVASLFAGFGLRPGGDGGSFLQKAPLPTSLAPRTETWNVVGLLPGNGQNAAAGEAILLTAHLDHLGMGKGTSGDQIYNGADDDASGTTAVIELARTFARAPRLPRTIVFALFGSEEIGGFGNKYFLAHPPLPLDQITANLEFEMIGRRDPALEKEGLWLTGYARSDLGPELVRHGANLVADPHPEQNFFRRSDNYALARQGIVAQTISSFGLHRDYHQPSDEISRIDFPHLTRAIASMVEPILWLARTKWKPHWLAGGRPV